MSSAGRTAVVLGGAVFIASLAGLHYIGGDSFWRFASQVGSHSLLREAIVLTGVAALAIVSALFAGADRGPATGALATGLSMMLLGQWFSAGQETYSGYESGYWICVAAAAVMSVGGLLGLAAGAGEPGHEGARAAGLTGSLPAPGWYADPENPAAQRYWSGTAWTEHTH